MLRLRWYLIIRRYVISHLSCSSLITRRYVISHLSCSSNAAAETSGEDGVGNPIGELQEFTQKKLMKPPIYEFSNEQGPPHNREFVCTIKLGKYTEKGG